MQYPDLKSFLADAKTVLAKGPVALILAEDAAELEATIRHHGDCGFKQVCVFAQPELDVPIDLIANQHVIFYDHTADQSMERLINQVIAAAGDIWLYYCFNAEFLFHPFSESRSVSEMVAFVAEERRDTVLTYVVDLYAGDLGQHPNAVSIEDAHLDRSGYYALSRKDKWNNDKDRQMNFFGGLRWRFEERIPIPRRRIDRVSLFRAKPGLQIAADHTFNDEEYNTYACPWHHSPTAALASFRTAKALKLNPGSTFDIETFRWHNSTPFEWHSQQLLDLGLMEPGQWF